MFNHLIKDKFNPSRLSILYLHAVYSMNIFKVKFHRKAGKKRRWKETCAIMIQNKTGEIVSKSDRKDRKDKARNNILLMSLLMSTSKTIKKRTFSQQQHKV